MNERQMLKIINEEIDLLTKWICQSCSDEKLIKEMNDRKNQLMNIADFLKTF